MEPLGGVHQHMACLPGHGLYGHALGLVAEGVDDRADPSLPAHPAEPGGAQDHRAGRPG